MQQLQDPNQSNVHNLNNVRREASGRFRNKKTECQKAAVDELETKSKIKYIIHLFWSISNLKNGNQLRTNTVKDEKGDLVTDFHSTQAKWRNSFSQLFNAHELNDVRQTEIHTPETLMHETRAFEVEMVLETPKIYKSPGIDQIPTKLLKLEVQLFAVRSINLLFLFGIRRNCLRSGRSRPLYLPIRRVIKQNVVIIGAYHFCQPRTKFYPTYCCQC